MVEETQPGIDAVTSPTALRPVKRIIRIVLMAPDWAPADRRSTPARLHCGKRRQLGKITAKAFASAVFHYPFSEATMSR
jgi:hypothetical protein